MANLLEQLGFHENPFAEYVAENEPDIDQYFVRAPYYDTVSDRGLKTRSFILFGARGAGKSASRLALFKQGWADIAERKPRPLLVTLDSYSTILARGLRRVTTRQYLLEIGYLVAEAVLVWLAALPEEDRQVYIEGSEDDERRLLITIIERFYLSRPEPARQITGRQATKLLNKAWTERTSIWLEKRWSQVVSLLGSIAESIIRKKSDLEVPLDEHLTGLLASPDGSWNEAHFARALLERLADFARVFGFTGITILVDKVDETDETSNSAKASAALLYPIVANTQLLEVDGVSWMLFLWDKIREEYAGSDFPVRLDKIANAEIGWEARYLGEMVDERLRYFSDGRTPTFERFFGVPTEGQEGLRQLIGAAMNSPRELIRVLDTVIREHEDLHADSDETPLLDLKSVEIALDKYSLEATQRIFDQAHLQQLRRVGRVRFINKEVQSALRINSQSARSRIKEWMDAGLVAHTGSRPAEGGSGGKPAYEYSVVDVRARRLLERQLSLGLDFELPQDDQGTG